MVSDPITIIFILALVVLISIWLEERYKMFRSLGAALVGILFCHGSFQCWYFAWQFYRV